MRVLILNRNRSISTDWSQCFRCRSNEFWRRLQIHVEGAECICSRRLFRSHVRNNQYEAFIIADHMHFDWISRNFDDMPAENELQFILLRDQSIMIPETAERFTHLPADDFSQLVNILQSIGCKPPSPKMRACAAYWYIYENIADIHSVEDLASRLALSSRAFRDEFKYYTGYTLRQLITARKILLIMDAIYSRKEWRNYYALAMEYGYKNDSPLENKMSRYLGKTLAQIEDEVKSLDYIQFMIYREQMRRKLFR